MYRRPDYSYAVTYGIVDPDNVDDNGDLIPEESESGFVVDGHDIELPPDVYGDEAADWMERNGVDNVVTAQDWYEEDGGDCPASEARCRSMAAFLLSGGYTEPDGGNVSDSYGWPDDQQDMFTGCWRRETCHLHGWPVEDLALIARLIKAGKASASLDGI